MANVLGTLFGEIAGAIREKTGETGKMKPAEFPEKIRDISVGGGSSADVRYVTFMSYDGTVEYGKKAVAVGDDCADPIDRGVFLEPTRVSDVQYNYTFAGWTTNPYGGLVPNALEKVTEDRTLYANFAEVVRYYAITFYDSDGVTVLKTESLMYNSTPSFTPAKREGYVFNGWTPEVIPVKGDASYIAKWAVSVAFADASWEDIARIAESGNAANHYKVGDRKTIPLKWYNGTTTDVTVEIIGINHDNLADGSGKAGITIGTVHALYYGDLIGSGTSIAPETMSQGWAGSGFRQALQDSVIGKLPQDMTQHIKTVKKQSKTSYNNFAIAESDDNLFIMSSTEISGLVQQGYSYGERYERFMSKSNRKKYRQQPSGVGTSYMSHIVREANYNNWISYIDSNGSIITDSSGGGVFCLCWCI